MQSEYPTSTTWPYVMVVLLLFGGSVISRKEWNDGRMSRMSGNPTVAALEEPVGTLVIERFEPIPPSASISSPSFPVSKRAAGEHSRRTSNPENQNSEHPIREERVPDRTGKSVPSNVEQSPQDQVAEEQVAEEQVAEDAGAGNEVVTDGAADDEGMPNEATIASEIEPIPPTTDSVAVIGEWPESQQLSLLLEKLSGVLPLRRWTDDVRTSLKEAVHEPIAGSDVELKWVAHLGRMSSIPVSLDVPLGRLSFSERTDALRLSHALTRRVGTWGPVLHVVRQQRKERAAVRAATEQATHELKEYLVTRAENADLGSETVSTWRQYLLVDDVRGALTSERNLVPLSTTTILDTLDEAIRRIDAPDLSSEQRRFLGTKPIQRWRAELCSLRSNLHSGEQLLIDLNAYEDHPSHAHAERVMAGLNRWDSVEASSPYRRASQAIRTHYRNANLRLAVSEELLNRLVPALDTFAEQVDDTILGAHVRGQNSTSTELSIAFVPDRERIRMQLLAKGNIRSETRSRKGPVTVFNHGDSRFSAGKELILEHGGIFTHQAQANASSAGSRLVGLESDLDQFPLLGWIVRGIARQQHDEQRPLFRAEIMRRIQRTASRKMDEQVQQRLDQVEQRLHDRVLHPLRQLDLDPMAMELRSTDERGIARIRLASSGQLGAHTPRPAALRDNMLSLQLHESAANNLIQQLDLHGKRMTVAELFESLSPKLGIQGIKGERDPEHEKIVLEFAPHDPLEFRFVDGRVVLVINLAELDNGRRTWKNLTVRGYYTADIDQLDVELVRDGSIELVSERLGLRDQFVLRGIFTQVLSKNHRLRILGTALAQQPRLQRVVVTQFAIRDGWLGISLGEKPTGVAQGHLNVVR